MARKFSLVQAAMCIVHLPALGLKCPVAAMKELFVR